MAGLTDFVSHLRNFPTSLLSPVAPIPDLSSPDDQASLSAALRDLEVEGSSEGRHTVLLAASLIPPEAHWEEAAWLWATQDAILAPDEENDGRTIGRRSANASEASDGSGSGFGARDRRNLSALGEEAERVCEWIAGALRDGVFKDKERWMNEGLGRHRRGDRCKRVLVRWGAGDLTTVLDLLAPIYLDPSRSSSAHHSRLTSTTFLFALTVEEDYDPSSPPQSTIMYKMIEHPILLHLLQSLMFDTGNNLFALSLKLLLALIPFGPILFTPHVPVLMVITGRAVCWRDRKFVDAGQGEDLVGVTRTYPPAEPIDNAEQADEDEQSAPDGDEAKMEAGDADREEGSDSTSARATTARPTGKNKRQQRWVVAKASDEPLTTPTALGKASRITQVWLVGMYGAWPSNVLAFIRDPVSYLAGKNISSPYTANWETIYPDAFLAKRAGPLLKNFSLHPMLIYFTSAAELQDTKRWEKNDPSEWLARAQTIAHMELTAGGMYKLLEGYGELPGQAEQSAEEAANLILMGGSGTATPLALAGPSGDQDGQPELSEAEQRTDDVERLRRENEDLRLEAMMTDRVRKQYLYHIARLHSYTIRFTTEESEMNRMLNRLKEETKRYEQLQASLEAQKEQASAAQQKHNKWLAASRAKADTLREERKQTAEQMKGVEDRLADSEARVKRLGDELAVVKNERFKLQNHLTEVTPKVKKIEDYELRNQQLTEMLRKWDEDVERVKIAEAACNNLKSRLYQMETVLRAVEKEKNDQAEIVRRLRQSVALKEDSRPSSPAPRHRPQFPDATHYLRAADDAKARADQLDAENRQLREELQRLKEAQVELADGEGTRLDEEQKRARNRLFMASG